MGLTTVARDLGAGTFGGCSGILAGQPLDTIKVRLQARPDHFRGIIDCTLKTLRHEGARGFFKGVVPPMVGNGPINALLFATEAWSVRTVSSWRGIDAQDETKLSHLDRFYCGCAAGFVSCIVGAPTELVKCQLQVQLGSSKPLFVNSAGCVRALLADAGVFSGLYRGFALTVWRDTPSFGLYFLVYNWQKAVWLSLLGVNEHEHRTQSAWSVRTSS
jgi:hypothetical protein